MDERQEFEEWARTQGLLNPGPAPMRKDGGYVNAGVDRALVAWEAGRDSLRTRNSELSEELALKDIQVKAWIALGLEWEPTEQCNVVGAWTRIAVKPVLMFAAYFIVAPVINFTVKHIWHSTWMADSSFA